MFLKFFCLFWFLKKGLEIKQILPAKLIKFFKKKKKKKNKKKINKKKYLSHNKRIN